MIIKEKEEKKRLREEQKKNCSGVYITICSYIARQFINPVRYYIATKEVSGKHPIKAVQSQFTTKEKQLFEKCYENGYDFKA